MRKKKLLGRLRDFVMKRRNKKSKVGYRKKTTLFDIIKGWGKK